jgi:hypothetical protein
LVEVTQLTNSDTLPHSRRSCLTRKRLRGAKGRAPLSPVLEPHLPSRKGGPRLRETWLLTVAFQDPIKKCNTINSLRGRRSPPGTRRGLLRPLEQDQGSDLVRADVRIGGGSSTSDMGQQALRFESALGQHQLRILNALFLGVARAGGKGQLGGGDRLETSVVAQGSPVAFRLGGIVPEGTKSKRGTSQATYQVDRLRLCLDLGRAVHLRVCGWVLQLTGLRVGTAGRVKCKPWPPCQNGPMFNGGETGCSDLHGDIEERLIAHIAVVDREH